MKRCALQFPSLMVLAVASALLLGAAPAMALGTVVAYDSLPSPTPPNVASQGFQCCGTAEIGDEVMLAAGTPRRASQATVLMSNWALNSTYPAMPAAGYSHPITLSIYLDEASARAHAPIRTITQEFVIPWRPEADPTCPGGTAWRAGNGACYNGLAVEIVFDLAGWNYDLPDQFIYGVAYDTNTWGYAPIGLPGPYESLNVGLNNNATPVAVGTDVDPDGVYWNTVHASWYSDGGAGGSGVFRPDTVWAPYVPAVQFANGFATKDDCKDYYKEQKKAFDAQQKADESAFEATNPTKAQKKAFDDQQKAAKKAFDDENKANEKSCNQYPK